MGICKEYQSNVTLLQFRLSLTFAFARFCFIINRRDAYIRAPELAKNWSEFDDRL